MSASNAALSLPLQFKSVTELRVHADQQAFERRQRGLVVLAGAPEDYPSLEQHTCLECRFEHECEFAWDPYNTDGDCLAQK
jgi:hypothetical protein